MDRTDLEKHLKTLITINETEDPFVSVAVDLSDPEAILRLREQERKVRITMSSAERASFERAIGRIEGTIESMRGSSAQGAAIFCREGADPYFLALRFLVPLPTELTVDTLPHIFRLVELKDSYDRYVVLIIAEEEARILEVSLGEVTRQIWAERPALRKRVGREWTRRQYQNHRRDRTDGFYREVIEVLERRVLAGGFAHLVIAGSPRAIGTLRPKLPKSLESRVVEVVSHSGKQAPSDVVRATIGTFVQREQLETLETVKLLREQIRRGTGLAVVGRDQTRDALEAGAADILLLSAEIGDDLSAREEREHLVRLANSRGTLIEIVQNEDLLDRYEGVGCLLRYPWTPVEEPVL